MKRIFALLLTAALCLSFAACAAKDAPAGPEEPDPAPSPGDILSFANGPKIHRRGNGLFLLLGLFSNAVCALSLLFEDQLFRWQLSFRVADPGSAEPSEWEMFNRWAGWITLTAVAFLAYAGAAGLI